MVRSYEKGPLTISDYMRTGFNQTTIQKILKGFRKGGLMVRDELPVENWAERPGNARPYRLTKRGIKLAEGILARKTGKMIVGPRERLDRLTKQMSADPPEIDGFTLPITVWYEGKIVRETMRFMRREPVPELEAWNRRFKPTLNQKELRQLQTEVENNSDSCVAELGTDGATIVRTITALKKRGEELPPLCILRGRTLPQETEDRVEVVARATVPDPIFASKGHLLDSLSHQQEVSRPRIDPVRSASLTQLRVP